MPGGMGMIDRVKPLKRCAVILGGAGALFVLMYLLQGSLLIGGLILIGIGVKILIEHTLL